jgi:methylenetetrahydrofolate reductase (NADPH)
MTKMLSSVCGAAISADLQKRLDAVDAEDKGAVLNLGIDFATEQCKGLLKEGAAGLHFYTMDRGHSTKQIISKLKADGDL